MSYPNNYKLPYKVRGWLFSKNAFLYGLGWWKWKPCINCDFSKASYGNVGRDIQDYDEVTVTLEWLSACLIVKTYLTNKSIEEIEYRETFWDK